MFNPTHTLATQQLVAMSALLGSFAPLSDGRSLAENIEEKRRKKRDAGLEAGEYGDWYDWGI